MILTQIQTMKKIVKYCLTTSMTHVTGKVFGNLIKNIFTHKSVSHFLSKYFPRHFTREALPRLDNYRNILSIQAAHRPTLDELHNATMTNKVN